jgi:hypothetical protein
MESSAARQRCWAAARLWFGSGLAYGSGGAASLSVLPRAQILLAETDFEVTAANSAATNKCVLRLLVLPLPPTELVYADVECRHGLALEPVLPSVIGAVDRFSTDQPLPAGLRIDAVTGALSGTPEEPNRRAATLRVTAMNTGGACEGVLRIRVLPRAPHLVFAATEVTLGGPVRLAPESRGGWIDSLTVAPALPRGLRLEQDGAVTGTPSVRAPRSSSQPLRSSHNVAPQELKRAAVYTIAAANEAGSTEARLSLAVVPPPPLLVYETAIAQEGEAFLLFAQSLGGVVDNVTVSPSLPAGLTLNAIEGSVSGRPQVMRAVWQPCPR